MVEQMYVCADTPRMECSKQEETYSFYFSEIRISLSSICFLLCVLSISISESNQSQNVIQNFDVSSCQRFSCANSRKSIPMVVSNLNKRKTIRISKQQLNNYAVVYFSLTVATLTYLIPIRSLVCCAIAASATLYIYLNI